MIAYGMLYTAVVGLPIALAALAVSAVLRRYGKPERLVWVLALLAAFALPVLSLLDPFARGTEAATLAPATGVIGLPEILVVPTEGATLDLGELLLAAWLLVSGVLVIRWAVAALRLMLASRNWSQATLDGVPVWMTEALGPAVAGTFRPRVLVPQWLRSLPSRQRSLVLLHEQEHIRAHDPKLIVLARLACVLTPWNPAVWFLSARLVRAVELDCDRRVLRRSGDVAAYGHTLLTVSERGPGRLVAVAAFAESEAPLRSRILAMTTPARTVSVVALLTSMVLGVVLMVGALEIPVPTVSLQISTAESAPRTSRSVERAPEEVPPPATGAEARPSTPDAPAPTPEAPVSARVELERLQAELRAAVRERARPEAEPGAAGPVPRPEQSGPYRPAIASEPTFTPYTVPPGILNREQIVRAMVREYPALLRDAGVGGTVRVYFFIDEYGDVQDTRIDQSSGHAALDEAALNVAGLYRFSPALNRDQPVPVWVSFPITFMVR